MSNFQQKRVMFALYQEPFIVPQEAGADWQVLKSFLFFDLLYVPSFLLEVTFLKLSDSFCLSVPLFAFLSVCVSLSLLPTCLPLPLPPSLFYAVSYCYFLHINTLGGIYLFLWH